MCLRGNLRLGGGYYHSKFSVFFLKRKSRVFAQLGDWFMAEMGASQGRNLFGQLGRTCSELAASPEETEFEER